MQDGEVWAPNAKDGFIRGQVVEIGMNTLTIETVNNEIINAPYSKVFPISNESIVNDNCKLMQLNEASLLENIKLRFFDDKIYTYTANILTVINPYKDLEALYTDKTMKKYKSKSIGKLSPHSFAIGEKAYSDMMRRNISQSVIVSGESGSGKTETTKHLLKYLATVYGEGSVNAIQERLIQANPLMEAFGNAQTVRNKNSSRFGKFIEVNFNEAGTIVGGHINTYLLEKSRIVGQSAGERNYHIFYNLLSGADDHLRSEANLKASEDYQCLGGTTRGEKDKALFATVKSAMLCIGMTEEEMTEIFKVVSAVMIFGNTQFIDSGDSKGGSSVASESLETVEVSAKLLGLSSDDLRYALTSRMMQTRNLKKGTTYMVPLKRKEALHNRNGLCKSLYTRLFNHIVEKINLSLPLSDESQTYIGVLDIAGFEYFELNSFEQFCINYCNEKLQHFFNLRVIREEQDLYQSENLGVNKIEFADNYDCIELIENSLYALNEEAKLPQSDEKHFTRLFHEQNSKHFRLQVPRKSKLTSYRSMLNDEGFIIRHYAGAVCYNTSGWLDKNSDTLHSSLEQLMLTSECSLVQTLYHDVADVKCNKKMVQDSVSTKFQKQLNELLDKLKGTATSFIRCLKPNQQMKPAEFEGGKVLNQLTSLGMVTALELMQAGFPSRIAFKDLYDMYSKKLPKKLKTLHPRVFCSALFRALGMSPNDYRFGVTRIFFKPGKFAEVDLLLNDGSSHMDGMIKAVEKWIRRQCWRRLQYAVLAFNKWLKIARWRMDCIIRIQKNIRMWNCQNEYRPRIRGVKAIKESMANISVMIDIAKEIKYDRDSVFKEIESLDEFLKTELESIKHGEVHTAAIQEKLIEVEEQVKILLEKVKETQHADKLRQIQEELEAQRKRKEEEERLRKIEEERLAEERRIKREMEEKRLREIEEEKRRMAEEEKRLAAEREKLEKERKEREEKERAEKLAKEQEERDRMIALSISEDNKAAVVKDEDADIKKSTKLTKENIKDWKYSELRECINTSCDIELLEIAREEFHRRLKAYQQWKTVNKKKKGEPKPDLPGAKTNFTAAPAAAGAEKQHRFFKVPFMYPSFNNPNVRGWWYAHFYGKWIVRQMEIHPQKAPLCLVAGKDDLKMCELELSATGLTRRKGSEITSKEFDDLWNCCGGGSYRLGEKHQSG